MKPSPLLPEERELPAAFSNRSLLIPAVVVLFSVAGLVFEGAHASKLLVENLPTPLNSTGLRLVDLARPSSSFGRLYDLTLEGSPARTSSPPGARLQVQLASNGKTRLIVLRGSHPPASRRSALFDLLRGRARLQIVPDRGWIDLGPPPPAGVRRDVQLVGLLPGPFGFAQLSSSSQTPPLFRLEVRRPDAWDPPVVTTEARYRVIAPSPVAAGEVLARFFFFVRASRVLQITAALALALLVFGWRSLFRGEAAKAVSCLVPSVVLLHAVLLPPLQGADETSHMATAEKVAFGEVPPNRNTYPRSISLVALALEQDRVQFHPDEPLPLAGPAERARLEVLLETSLAGEAAEDGPWPPGAGVQNTRTRSPLFYGVFGVLRPLLRSLSVLDRISAYRIVSSLAGMFFFAAGALALRKAQLGDQKILLYGLVFLIPYMVVATASCSNYAPAIGLGGFLAAAALNAVLDPVLRRRVSWAVLFVVGSWAGVPIWPDFIFPALAATGAIAGWAVYRLVEKRWPGRGRLLPWLGLGTVVLFLFFGLDLVSRLRFGNIGTRLPIERPGLGSSDFNLMVLVSAAPFLITALLVLLVLRASRRSPDATWSLLRGLAVATGCLVVILFLSTPYTTVPFETYRLTFPQLVRAHNLSFWSNNLSWDQDRLFWKYYLGAFGWHDAFYPDWVYAIARWLAVALLILLPILSARFVSFRPRTAVALLLISGSVLSFCVVTEILRYLSPASPIGRFILPYIPMAALPVVVAAEAPGRERILRSALAVGVALHVWTSLFLIPARYVLGA